MEKDGSKAGREKGGKQRALLLDHCYKRNNNKNKTTSFFSNGVSSICKILRCLMDLLMKLPWTGRQRQFSFQTLQDVCYIYSLNRVKHLGFLILSEFMGFTNNTA